MKYQYGGTVDRVVRVVFGLAVLSLVFVGPQTMWGWIGLVPLVTGMVGWCPLYALLPVNTCGKIRADSTASESIGSGGFVFVGKRMAPATLSLWIITERGLGHELQEWYATDTSRRDLARRA